MDKNNARQLTQIVEIDQIISAAYYEFAPEFSNDGEKHSGWEFIYVEQGRLRILTEESGCILKSGEMICLEPMKYHSIRPSQGKASAIIFSFDSLGSKMPDFENKIFSINHQQKQYLNDIVSVGGTLLQTQSPYDIGKADSRAGEGAYNAQILKNTIELLVLSLVSGKENQRQMQGDLYRRSVQRKNITNDIIQYLNDTIAEPVKLQDIADKFSYSLSSIKRIFKKETGLSIIEYQNNNRITQAKRMLENSNLSIEEISGSLGFSNACYFSRTFKKREGVSPSAYRKSTRNKAFFGSAKKS